MATTPQQDIQPIPSRPIYDQCCNADPDYVNVKDLSDIPPIPDTESGYMNNGDESGNNGADIQPIPSRPIYDPNYATIGDVSDIPPIPDTESGYMNNGDESGNNGVDIQPMPSRPIYDPHYATIGDVSQTIATQGSLGSASSSRDNPENAEYMTPLSTKNYHVLHNANETDLRRKTDGKEDEPHYTEDITYMIGDVHRNYEESDNEICTSSTCAIHQTCCHLTECHENPIGLLPKMVEVFRPLIVDSIKVSQILPYLSLHVDKERLQRKEESSSKEAASFLLDEIDSSQEPGKWTAFLDALKIAGYEYVSKKLMGETEKDLTVQKQLLQVFTPSIVENLDPKELTDHLFAKELISIADKEEIENKQRRFSTAAATLVLLDRIPRRKDNWFSEFVAALRDCGFEFIADELDIQYQSVGKTEALANKPKIIYARQKSTSDEESNCRGSLSEEVNLYIFYCRYPASV